ncbi:MAG: hypothetical protein JNG89_21535 [Planctomycetaceae bacterium]|nr:hypothetical protein [Planctomycetaceae bacterium]
MARHWQILGLGLFLAAMSLPGCVCNRGGVFSSCSDDCNNQCGSECDSGSCRRCGVWGRSNDCNNGSCRPGCGSRLCWWSLGCWNRRSNAIPDTLPLGSTVQSHYQVMETNGEAMDFIIYQHEFMGETAQLTPDGKDHILEVAARMRSAPFPVVIERTWNNADPELDGHRRNLVAQVLTDLGNPDAQQRTVVATSYGPGYNSIQAEPMYYQHTLSGSGYGSGYGTYGNTMGTYGGFGGGTGGGVGFGP